MKRRWRKGRRQTMTQKKATNKNFTIYRLAGMIATLKQIQKDYPYECDTLLFNKTIHSLTAITQNFKK